jgi:hypothetical protein
MAPSADTPAASTPARRWFPSPFWSLLGVGLVLLLLGVVVVLARQRAAPPASPQPAVLPVPDPRLTYSGPFRNVNPAVRYVGDSACAGCHPDQVKSYRQHPMGQSLAPIRDVLGQPPHAGPDAHFTALGSLFRVERRGQRLWHRQTRLDETGRPVYTLDLEVHYVIGSGTRGYSYLSERAGGLVQTPISWFSQKGVWDLSPTFTAERLRGRPIAPGCLFCHANRSRPRQDTESGYEQPLFAGYAIGCERCHGPGELHVRNPGPPRAMGGRSVHPTIVNPGKLEPPLREAVCEQCHLQGEARVLRRGRGVYDFRPGLPLQEFWSVFVRDRRPGAAQKAVNHVEQMYQSQCISRPVGKLKLGCTTCHDPHVHVGPAKRETHYRAACLKCHDPARDQRGCSEAPAKRRQTSPPDSCIGCHMPRYRASDIAHTAGTDHRIVRRRRGSAEQREEAEERFPVPFYRSLSAGPGPDREAERDLGIALAGLAATGKGDPQRFARRAAALLAECLSGWPDDVPGWEARGQALEVLGQRPEALAAYEAALARAPRRERALQGAARMAQETNDRAGAIVYWRRAVAVAPGAPDYRGNLALLLAHAGQWDEARAHCQAWLRLDPGNLEARRLWVRCLLQQGERAAARAEMDKLRRLR